MYIKDIMSEEQRKKLGLGEPENIDNSVIQTPERVPGEIQEETLEEYLSEEEDEKDR